MVQRKVPNSLGFQADHVKSEKLLGNLKPTSSPHQDGKSRGSDMKKKMKRSRSINLSHIESFNSSSLKKTVPQPHKHAMIKTSGGSPNYMKATTSSEARKERSPVSSLNTPSSLDTQNLRTRNTRNSRNSSDSSNKLNKSLAKSSSLKLVRTLTKTPSFKPLRSAAKKCSRVALCEDANVQKATCSSTLKDSKFPPYLVLNPGGTESEGTSVLKVCPYSYCSLNGHYYTPLPPLKCFLKAKRRSLKAQKSSKLEVLSPRRVKPSGNQTEEVGMDFFIEIYAKNTDDAAQPTERHAENDEGRFRSGGEPKEENSECFFRGDDEAAAEQENKDQVSENLSDASPQSEIDFQEKFEENQYANLAMVWMAGDFLEEQKIEASIEEDGNNSETSDMEWEEGQLFNMETDDEVDYSNKPEKEYCIGVECVPEVKQFGSPDETKIIRSDDIISNCTEEIPADCVLQELFDEETASYSAQCYNSDSGMEGDWEIFEPTQDDADLTHDIDAVKEPTAMQEKSEEFGRDLADASSAVTVIEESILEPVVANENILMDRECERENEALNTRQKDTSVIFDDRIDLLQAHTADSSESSDDTGEAETNKCQKLKETEADQYLAGLQDLPSGAAEDPIEEQQQVLNDSFQTCCEATEDNAELNDSQNHTITQVQLDKIPEDSNSTQGLIYKIELAQKCVHQLDGQNESTKVVENRNVLAKDQERAKKFKNLASKNSDEQSDWRICQVSSAENETGVENMKVDAHIKSDVEQNSSMVNNGTSTGSGSRHLQKGSNSGQELPDACSSSRKWAIKCKNPIINLEEERQFNPRGPNFLPLVPGPEAEKVDLKHQIMDDRKNAEEWMLDYALRQTVTKLAPARKKKVALLVEAFETVLPIPKYNPRMKQATSAFSHSRPIQACS